MNKRDLSDLLLVRGPEDLDTGHQVLGGLLGRPRNVVTLQTDVELETFGKLGSIGKELARVKELKLLLRCFRQQ